MGYKYLGPSDHLLLKEGGKVYHPGDEVPVSKEVAMGLVRAGHVFEELTPRTGEPRQAFAPAEQLPGYMTTAPTGDNGAWLPGYEPGVSEPGKGKTGTTAANVVPAAPGAVQAPNAGAQPA